MSTSSIKNVKVWLNRVPYSLDPLEHDAMVHHVAVRPLFTTLVSEYKSGEVVGLAAESWKTNDDLKEWTFKIRPGLAFSNGDLLTPNAVASSLCRMAYIMKSRGSKSGLLEHLEGFDSLSSASQTFPGISYTSSDLTLKFTKPMPEVVEKIGFGLYSIVHQSDFDAHTGKWKTLKTAITSGPYELLSWNESAMKIKARTKIPKAFLHDKFIEEYTFLWSEQMRAQSEIIMGADFEKELDTTYEFMGPPAASIAFARCFSWNEKSSPCSNKANRQKLRSDFYSEMKKQEYDVIKSFFPLIIEGIKSFSDKNSLEAPDFNGRKIATVVRSLMHLSLFNAADKSLTKAFEKNGITLVESKLKSLGEVRTQVDPNLPTYSVDMFNMSSGIRINEPRSDIKFMFESAEGIALPDPTGKIHNLLKDSNFSVQDVNQQLWEDAIIWPLGHYSSGLWVKRKLLDFSLINLSLPPTDLAFVGSK